MLYVDKSKILYLPLLYLFIGDDDTYIYKLYSVLETNQINIILRQYCLKGFLVMDNNKIDFNYCNEDALS